jgi:hypothetical protein
MAPDFIGTLPGWITAASTTTGVAAVIIAYFRRGVSLKSLSNADGADIRDHYAEELERVTARQHECELREGQLRTRVAELENDILGLIRIIGQASADKVLLLEGNVPKDIREMAERIIGRGQIQ